MIDVSRHVCACTFGLWMDESERGRLCLSYGHWGAVEVALQARDVIEHVNGVDFVLF